MSLPRYFPYEKLRKGQQSLVRHIVQALEDRVPLIAHAPTGLGKTVASLSPALERAIQDDLVVIFVTPRHTQHLIALETMQIIKDKFDLSESAVSIVGKQHLCLQSGVSALSSSEFSSFCKRLREDDTCEFYTNTKTKNGGFAPLGEVGLGELKTRGCVESKVLHEVSEKHSLCPYELGIGAAKQAKVIVTDYYYVFHPTIREHFLKRIGKSLEQCILVIDEGHNLPGRLRKLLSTNLSTGLLNVAYKEAEKYGFGELVGPIAAMNDLLESLSSGMSDEKLVAKGDLMKGIGEVMPYTDLMIQLESAGEEVQKQQQRSALASLGAFLDEWAGSDMGYARILSRKDRGLSLRYQCLDPSVASEVVVQQCYWSLLMSGTLTPPEMYRDLLGFPVKSMTQEYPSPFSSKNRMAFVIPKTTTKYSSRSAEQMQQIAGHITQVVHSVPGNTAVFFPSYALRDSVAEYLRTSCNRTIFMEDPALSKHDREDLLERFRGYKDSGAVLLCAASGSFGEGVDLPGDLLKGVIVVGLPLGRPDLETKELIAYYDHKFGQGWNYGYILPAFATTLQNAGRCIRTEEDRGVIAFLDERYAWPRYLKCFPDGWDMKVLEKYKPTVDAFFTETSAE